MKKRTAPRIIAGKLKGRRLKSLTGNMTRPITDRVKENLFNILGKEIHGCSFLDAFGGTGSVGIEAYSRGADFTLFLEKNQKPYIILKENLEMIDNKSAFSVKKTDAIKFLKSESNLSFDFVFIAPPQYHGIWKESLLAVDENCALINNKGLTIVQIDPKELIEIDLQSLAEVDRRKYGSTLLLFYEKQIN